MIEETWLVDVIGREIGRLQKKELAIDVGANIGEWTRELSANFTEVLAFEPDPRARRLMPTATNVKVDESAVYNRCGAVMFHLRPDAGQNSILEEHPIGAGGQAPAPTIASTLVQCVTLDSAAPGGADFVKIDVEGAEREVLEGCRDVGRWKRTVFVVECHDTRGEVAEMLWRMGKSVRLITHPIPVAHPGHCWLIGSP